MSTIKDLISKEDAIKHYKDSPRAVQLMFENIHGKSAFLSNPIEKFQNFLDIESEVGTIKLPYSITTTDPFEKQLNASLQMLNIAKAYNQGWIPNWDDTNEPKYSNYAYRIVGSWSVSYFGHCYFAGICSGVCFQKREYVEDVNKKFPEIVKAYLMIS